MSWVTNLLAFGFAIFAVVCFFFLDDMIGSIVCGLESLVLRKLGKECQRMDNLPDVIVNGEENEFTRKN